jgi:hypothetical protein
VLNHFRKAVEDKRRRLALDLLEGRADSYENYQWHVGYSSGMLAAIQLLEEIVDADADLEERG